MRAVLLDRDGVINRDRADHVRSWDQFEFLPGALAGLRLLAATGTRVAVVSNQSAVGRGLMSAADLALIHRRMAEAVRRAGGRVDAVLSCPHTPVDRCTCRKPRPGLLSEALRRLQVTEDDAVMVGDSAADLEAARSARLPAVLVLSGRGAQTLVSPETRSGHLTYIARDLLDAARWLAGREQAWPWR